MDYINVITSQSTNIIAVASATCSFSSRLGRVAPTKKDEFFVVCVFHVVCFIFMTSHQFPTLDFAESHRPQYVSENMV